MILTFKSISIEITPKAQKDLTRVPQQIAEKFQLWADSIKLKGLNRVRQIPGYHDEPLKGKRVGQRSIRLNRSYRAIYEVIDGNAIIIQVQEVTKHDY